MKSNYSVVIRKSGDATLYRTHLLTASAPALYEWELLCAELSAAQAEIKRLREALEKTYQELKHAYIFVKHKEKMADVGLEIYRETITIARKALEMKGE